MKKRRDKDQLPIIQDADLAGKVVLVRVDHNVVKNGIIRDPYRIDRTIGTLYNIVERGGRIILMTHVGRPRDKKTGEITCDPSTSVEPIATYLERKLHSKIHVPTFRIEGRRGIVGIDTSINLAIKDLRQHKIGGIYLPNTRWFEGEEAAGELGESFARQLAGLADVFVNDAFGSWQPHASTYDITRYLPAYAGFLMQEEIDHLDKVLSPDRPFVAVVAGAKYDTKIGPLNELYKKVDHLILGGVIYNTYLCAKYNIRIAGVSEADIIAAKKLVSQDKKANKIVELPYIVESDILGKKVRGKYRTIAVQDLGSGNSYGYILDIDARSFSDKKVAEVVSSARTIFVNAVMGYTPHFTEGSEALDRTIDKNRIAWKFYGGGDTLQEFKSLCPGLYLSVLDDALYYFFTGGGSVLKAIEESDALGMKPVQALMENKKALEKGLTR
ncbi:MAG: phosphoglycerate kinase [Deltaproteobacteria bacterium]|nr:phosphoglycerate kinase [Deltaproteobacteria bacterium]MBW2019302.1 phosphoglycerate kinase [Deltaproteobacteria bacterium]MBW2074077.1 phosphoglycerate kinase [Deltaproteobacteria bacterium]RLB82593.1 MAG: phosphoglycerate kinase [Deltaproteobacteria bacterium]